MKVSFDSKTPKTDALVFFVTEGGKLTGPAAGLDKESKGVLTRVIAAEKFEGKKAQVLTIAGAAGTTASHIVLIGTGSGKDLTLLDLEKMGSTLTTTLNAKKAKTASVAFELSHVKIEDTSYAVSFAAGALLNSYRFDKYLTKEAADKKPTLQSLTLVVKDPGAARKSFANAQKLVDAVTLTRDVVSEPPNVLYPESFANIIKKELAPLGIEVKILGMKELQKLGLGALIAVGQGSTREPKLVTMHYKGAKSSQRNIAFVGKGVTFDTGGISIKPGPGMEEMKWDMAGAGAVLGLMKSLAGRKAKANVVGVVALAENMPNGNAYRPGDIITSMSGQTIEVHNTDAEGRMILCDALWYCQQVFKPTQIVDLATLTGAVIIALGGEYGGLFSNDDALAQDLINAGKITGEKVWMLPMSDAWDKAIDTPQADMKNISGNRDAGSAIGAHFLKRFIQDGVKWAHLDIAGVAWSHKDKTSNPKGATAFGVRLLDQYVADIHEKH